MNTGHIDALIASVNDFANWLLMLSALQRHTPIELKELIMRLHGDGSINDLHTGLLIEAFELETV